MSVPLNVIALWTGTLASVPANWNICNGNGSTPDLRDKFVRGAPASTEAGSTGGASVHTHTEQSGGAHTHSTDSVGAHQHTVVSSGGHVHASYAYASSGTGLSTSNRTTGGAHQHTTANGSSAHTHTADSQGAHSHTLSDCSEGRPPWYDVVYLQAAAGATAATNLRIIWSDTVAAIPTGFSEDTALREKFVRGASNGVDGGGTGGSADHTHATQNNTGHTHGSDSQGSHYHSFANDLVAHNHGSQATAAGTRIVQTAASYNWYHQHANSDTIAAHSHTFQSGGVHNDHGNVGSTDSNKSLPSYKQAVFIKNDSASAIPVGGILIWAGLIADIPANYVLCDGTSPRPDYRGVFLRGNPNGGTVGATGGADTHIHTDNAGGIHSDHTQDAFSTQHTHATTNSVGDHTHGTVSGTRTTGATMNTDSSLGAHTHTYTAYTWSHTHTIQNSASHTHTIDSASTLPPYYEVQFIYYLGASTGQPYIMRVQGIEGMKTWS